MNKIPSELRLVINRKFSKDKLWQIDELLNTIKTELEARERCTTMKVSTDNNELKARNATRKTNTNPYHGRSEFTLS